MTALFIPLLLALACGFLLLDRVHVNRAAGRGSIRATDWRTPFRLALTIAVLASAGSALVVLSTGQAPSTTQIAMVEVSAGSSGSDLRIGGDRTGATLGWPQGFFAPEVTISPLEGGDVQVEVADGGGFIRAKRDSGCLAEPAPSRSKFVYFNGTQLPNGAPVDISGYTVTYKRAYRALWWRETVRVDEAGAGLVARVDDGALGLGRLFARDGQPRSLESMLRWEIARLRGRGGADAEQARDLEAWAQRLVVLRDGSGLLVAQLGDPGRKSVVASSCESLQAVWPGRRSQSFAVSSEDGKITVRFPPPWRAATPLPPVEEFGSDGLMVLTGEEAPDDFAFVPPAGDGLADVRTGFRLTRAADGAWVLGAATRNAVLEADGAGVSSSPRLKGMMSFARFAFGPQYLGLATVRHMPDLRLFAIGIVVALVSLSLVLLFVLPLLSARDAWLVAGIAVILWELLTIRLVLAFRYALEPRFLDSLAVTGVSRALVALAVLPATVVLMGCVPRVAGRLRTAKSRERTRWALWLVAIVGWLCVSTILELAVCSGMWAVGSRESTILGALAASAIIMVALLMLIGSSMWLARDQNVETTFTRARAFWREFVSAPQFGAQFVQLIVLVAGFLAILWLIALLSRMLPKAATAFDVDLVGTLICLGFVFLWVASKAAFDEALGPRDFSRLVVAGVVVVLMPSIAVPLLMSDPGAAIMAAALLIAASVVLIVKPRMWTGLATLTLLTLALAGAFGLYLQAPRLVEVGPGAVGPRLLAFKEGPSALKSAPEYAQESAVRLANAVEHSWSNAALVHAGGLTGMGFGAAPVRKSDVRQDTLQHDSVFSFFVCSEFGLLSGIALLVLYLMPALLLLESDRKCLSIEHSLAFIVCFALFLEAVFHAAMNVGLMPFTGRNLPLLAVNSRTDLLRWAMLLGLVLLIANRERRGTPVPYLVDAKHRRVFSYLVVGLALCAAGAVFIRGSLIIGDDSFKRLSWSAFTSQVQELIDGGELALDAKTLTIAINPASAKDGRFRQSTVLLQEINRFNASPVAEKLGDPRAALTASLYEGMPAMLRDTGGPNSPRGTRRLARYFELVDRLRRQSEEFGRYQNPLLFVVLRPEGDVSDGGGSSSALEVNPRFRRSLSFEPMVEFPTVSMSGGAAQDLEVLGPGFSIPLRRRSQGVEVRASVVLDAASAAVTLPDEYGGIDVMARIPQGSKSGQIATGRVCLDLSGDGIIVKPIDGRLSGGSGGQRVLHVGDQYPWRLEGAEEPIVLTVTQRHASPVVGRAWAMGNWVLASSREHGIPWARSMRDAAVRWTDENSGGSAQEFEREFGQLLLEPDLQLACARFAAAKGPENFGSYLQRVDPDRVSREPSAALPRRVAITVVGLPDGDIRAVGGWPRTSFGRSWERTKNGEVIPPASWVDELAPRVLRPRYAGDRNFDQMLVGSASKPLWAAVVLGIHPDLDRRLSVFGPEENESDIFGIPISSPWEVGASRSISGRESDGCDFNSYLARSDNRYQVRLGFLGLAIGNRRGIQVEELRSPSARESMDGGRTAWRRYPVFEPTVGFSVTNPRTLRGVDETAVAAGWKELFGVDVKTDALHTDERRWRVQKLDASIWSGDENDRILIENGRALNRAGGKGEAITNYLGALCPPAVNLELDSISTPRDYVSWLLGGRSNMWPNVSFAGAFGSVVSGRPVVVHLVDANDLEPREGRRDFTKVASRIRPGLEAAVSNSGGTAWAALHGRAGARDLLRQLKGYRVYAKTGTLHGEHGISRIALALVKWSSEKTGKIDRGLILSIAVEDPARTGVATQWMSEFLESNRELIVESLNESAH